MYEREAPQRCFILRRISGIGLLARGALTTQKQKREKHREGVSSCGELAADDFERLGVVDVSHSETVPLCFELLRPWRAELSPHRSKKREKHREGVSLFFGAPAENRTPDTLIKSQVLYQLSYRGVSTYRSYRNMIPQQKHFVNTFFKKSRLPLLVVWFFERPTYSVYHKESSL